MTDRGSLPDLGRLERRLLDRSGRREGREIRFLCPAHDDSHPSARWCNSKAVWFCDVCRAGGGWRDLSRRLELEPDVESALSGGDLRARNGSGGSGGAGSGGTGSGGALRDHRREIVATYAYTDGGGRLLYEVLRLLPKAFSCRRPDGTGGWLWNLQGVERVLYRLPEVVAAVQRDEIVFFVEGEKDADAIAALGFAATTHAGGAGKWRPEYAQALRGGRVVVLADNDEPGRRHAETVLGALRPQAGAACRLELPGLPAKGDFCDWLAARRDEGLADLQIACRLLDLAGEALRSERSAADRGAAEGAGAAAAGAAPAGAAGTEGRERRSLVETPAGRGSRGAVRHGGAAAPAQAASPSAAAAAGAVRCLADIAPQAVSFLWEPYLPLGKLTLLEGDPGQGKSWLAAAIAAAGSRGRGLPGLAAFPPFRTLFLTAEDGLPDTLRPRLESLGADCGAVFACDQPLALDLHTGLATLAQALATFAPRLVVVDPLVAFLGRATDIYRANEVRSVLAPLMKLVERHSCALLAVRHLNKAKLGRTLYAGQGSIDFTAAARSVLLAGSAAEDADAHALIHIKSNLAPHGPALAYHLLPAFLWQGPSRLTANDLLAAAAPADEASAEDDARTFLRSTLAGPDPLPARLVLNAARDAGISQRTLKRAKRKEGVRTTRRGFGAGSTWLWSLPEAGVEGEQMEGDGVRGAEGDLRGEEVHTEGWPPSAIAGLGGTDGGLDGDGAGLGMGSEGDGARGPAGGEGGLRYTAHIGGEHAEPRGSERNDGSRTRKKDLLL
jgi:putative DNA primase/helicase